MTEKQHIYNNSTELPKSAQNGVGGEQKPVLKENLLEGKVKELTETLQRLQAEFENYQKRTNRQNEEYKVFANARLIEEILPVLDSLEAGAKHNKELVLIHEQLMNVLKKQGLKKIKAEKKAKFDHEKMECLMQESDKECREDEVVNVLLNGYELNGKILRPAKVSVNVNQKNNENEKKSGNEKVEQLKKEILENKPAEKEKNGEKEEMNKMDFKIEKMEFD